MMGRKSVPGTSKYASARNGKLPELYIIEHNSLATSSLRQVLGDSDVHFLSNADLSSISNEKPVIIIDATTLGVAADKFVPRVRLRFPSARILIIAEGLSDDDICKLLGCGVHGFVPYDQLCKLPLATQAMMRDHLWIKPHILETYVRRTSEPSRCRSSQSLFTPREIGVLRLLKGKLSNKEIGSELNLSERTVKFHLANIYRKLGVHDRDAVIDTLQCSGTQILQQLRAQDSVREERAVLVG